MTFNKQLAIACAQTIQGLYSGKLSPNVVSPETDTQALVEKQPDGSYAIIFPGTASLRDMLTDARVKKTEWHAGNVHEGFHAAYDSVREKIEALLPADARLVIAGHSLGGALASLAAHDLGLESFYKVEQVITFGSPRVGNGLFARSYDDRLSSRTFRLVNDGDPVPHLPWVCGSYHHVRQQVYLSDRGTIRVDQPTLTALSEVDQTILALIKKPHLLAAAFDLFAPHHITSYLTKLNLVTP